jgi:hypothetical protein
MLVRVPRRLMLDLSLLFDDDTLSHSPGAIHPVKKIRQRKYT